MATVAATRTRESRRVAFDARLALGVGFVHVIRVLAEEKRVDLFNEIVAESLLRLEEGSSQPADAEDTEKAAAVLSIVGDEIRVLSGLVSAFADESYQEAGKMQSGTTTSPDRRRFVSLPTYVLSAVRKALPSILHCATKLCGDEVSHIWSQQTCRRGDTNTNDLFVSVSEHFLRPENNVFGLSTIIPGQQ